MMRNLNPLNNVVVAAFLLCASTLPVGAADSIRESSRTALLRGVEFVQGAGSRALSSIDARAAIRSANPVGLVRQVSTNYRDHRFYGGDLKEYSSIREALVKGCLAPTDLKQNVRAAAIRNINPAALALGLITPLAIEAQRQIVSGKGLDVAALERTLDPRVIGASYLCNMAGDCAGAAVQSGLACLGPAGAVAGFLARPALGYLGSILGMAVGENLAKGKSPRNAVADSLREFDLGRDGGQLLGSAIGATLGQVLIPIPVVGGLVGGVVGATLGTAVGAALSRSGLLAGLCDAIEGAIDRLADWIDGSRPGTEASTATTPGDAGEAIALLGESSEGPGWPTLAAARKVPDPERRLGWPGSPERSIDRADSRSGSPTARPR